MNSARVQVGNADVRSLGQLSFHGRGRLHGVGRSQPSINLADRHRLQAKRIDGGNIGKEIRRRRVFCWGNNKLVLEVMGLPALIENWVGPGPNPCKVFRYASSDEKVNVPLKF